MNQGCYLNEAKLHHLAMNRRFFLKQNLKIAGNMHWQEKNKTFQLKQLDLIRRISVYLILSLVLKIDK